MLEDPDIKDYILNFAKRHYVERRDNPLDTLPHSVFPDKFYINQYNEYKSKLERLKNLTDSEAKDEEIAYRKNQKEECEKYIDEETLKVKNLTEVIEKIGNWNCPESLKELKDLMIEDISSDICQHTKRLNFNYCVDAEVGGKEFKEELISRYQNIVDNCLKNAEREQRWVNETNRILKDLKDDLGDW